ncbi:MAG: peptidoglycan DD-metalloendopeptidase family protein [Candidatus Eremiobacteraeota bacterium]|nr:peptidoglycan DD-metalloendopeptidase family protein [Candidatus Eremiobacteraeota bacterium]
MALHSPVHGALVVATAFGQLMQSAGGTRYAYPAISLAYKAGKPVYSALEGRARYVEREPGFGPAILVTAKSGAQVLYASFARPIRELAHTSIRVKAGQQIAVSGRSHLRFVYAPGGSVTSTGAQANPCGSGASNGASATISVMPESVAVTTRFHAVSVNGTPLPPGPFPSGSPDVPTPEGISAANVVSVQAVAPTIYEHSDTFASFYVVLCGNAVFATGHPRYAGPFPYPSPFASSTPPAVAPSLPPIVFFRDAGAYGTQLVEALPAPYARACPAPPPANTYTFTAPVFGQPGQTRYVYYWLNTLPPSPVPTDYVTFNVSDAKVVTMNPASPSPLPVFSAQPAPWPPPSPRGEMTAVGTGAATIQVQDALCNCPDAAINVTVLATPVPAPIPTPLPNT